MDGRKTKQLVKPETSTTKVMIHWLTRANISIVDQTKGVIVLKLLKKCPSLYAFLAVLFQEIPRTNLLTIKNLIVLERLFDFDATSTLAALRALDNAGQLTQHSFNKISRNPATALFTANKFNGIPDEKDKSLIENFVELRKSTRILAQGNRTATGEFLKLPIEIWLKILKKTCQPSTLVKKVVYNTILNAMGPISRSQANTRPHR